MSQFAPSVLLEDGTTYTPEGWMWVLSYAIRGIPWAVEEAKTKRFNDAVDAWRNKVELEKCQKEANELELQLVELRSRIEELKGRL